MFLRYLGSALAAVCIVGLTLVVYILWEKSEPLGECADDSICNAAIVVALNPELAKFTKQCRPLCQTKNCIMTAARMYELIDDNILPCDDFYQFACGNYVRQNYPEANDPLISVTMDSGQGLFRDVRRIIENFPETQKTIGVSHSSFLKMKTSFEMCMEHETCAKSSAKDILEVLSEHGLARWPGFEEPEWRVPNGTMDEFLAFFHAINVGDFVYLYTRGSEGVITNSTSTELVLNRGSLLIRSEETYLNLNNIENRKELQKLKAAIIGVFELFDIPSKEAEEMSTEIIQLDIQLARFFKQWDEKWVAGGNLETSAAHQALGPNSTKWYEFICHYLSFLQINQTFHSQVVLVARNKLLLDELKDIIDGVPHRILANYMVFRLVEKYKSYTDFFFVATARGSFMSILDKLSYRSGLGKCSILAIENFQEVLAPAYMEQYFHTTAVKMFNELFDAMVESTSSLIGNMTWIIDEDLRTILKTKLYDLDIVTKHFLKIIDYKKIDEKYKNLPVHEDNFLKNTIAYVIHRKSYEFRNTENWNGLGYRFFEAFAAFSSSRIIIGLGILKFPLFAINGPNFANLGSIGYVLGHEMGHKMFSTLMDFNGEQAFLQSFEKQKSCLISQYSKYFYDSIDVYVNGRVTLFENFPDQIAINAAFQAYKGMHNHQEPKLIPVYGFTDDALFFISSSQAMCESNASTGFQLYSQDTHTAPNFRIPGQFSNMPEFSRIFGCPLGSNMNPAKKCDVIQ